MNEHERDEVLEKTIKDIPQMSQVQYSTNTQLEYLRIVAHKLGLYDGADVIKKLLENQEHGFWNSCVQRMGFTLEIVRSGLAHSCQRGAVLREEIVL